ncbi:hypothetical protein [Acinetobacter baumannii]|uniref:hypothetical protein n=1 Tax=Acinetobacter baumannii TaxID=470 RepID=UPI003B841E89
MMDEAQEKQAHEEWYKNDDPLSYKFYKALSPEYEADFYTSEKAWLARAKVQTVLPEDNAVNEKTKSYYKERLYWALHSSKTKKTQLNWHHAMYTACTGASHGYQLCTDLGVDPEATEFIKTEVSVGRP